MNENLEEKNSEYVNPILNFEGNLIQEQKSKFWVLTSDSIDYTLTPSSATTTDINEISYAFGVKEKIKGIYKTKFENEINNTDYNTLKEQWNYPQRKEFEILIYEGLDLANPIYTISKNSEITNEQVNVLQWSDWFINENSSREIITIMVRTW